MMNIHDLFLTADDFANDAYGWLTNQIGHMFLVGAPLYALTVWLMKRFGHVDKAIAITVVSVAYLAFEICVQGWHGNDTTADWLFVTLGAVLASQIRIENLWIFWASVVTVLLATWAIYG